MNFGQINHDTKNDIDIDIDIDIIVDIDIDIDIGLGHGACAKRIKLRQFLQIQIVFLKYFVL